MSMTTAQPGMTYAYNGRRLLFVLLENLPEYGCGGCALINSWADCRRLSGNKATFIDCGNHRARALDHATIAGGFIDIGPADEPYTPYRYARTEVTP